MAIDLLVTTERIKQDPTGREFIKHIQDSAARLGLDDAVLYYDFPTYSDYETVTHKPDALLVSRRHGILAIRFIDGGDGGRYNFSSLESVDESLGQFCSILIGRLLKSKALRQSRANLRFDVTPVMFFASAQRTMNLPEMDSEVVTSLAGINTLLAERSGDDVGPELLAEMRSVIEGAKALTRPQKRVIENPDEQRPAAALAKLEAEIANFDQRQRRAALITVIGPQRIRGLAGSGKTVILAMKAAHLHLTRPEDHILITFYTRSLRASIKHLITRFFRHYKDEDPDWDHIHIRHSWGGKNSSGTYADACRRQGLTPLPFGTAKSNAGLLDPFDFACRDLLQRTSVAPYYDHILIDEGQDFPGSFYELCYALAKGERDKKSIVWAYDELQNILNIKIRSPEQLFGEDVDGQPRVSLERSARDLPPGATNDTVLSKCYRTQREVLVTAHALGFGIYKEIVQLLESREHWEDVGYEVETGELQVGTAVRISRPAENSPVSIDQAVAGKVIDCHIASTANDEVTWIASGIREFIAGGLQPEDIVVIALDDRNAKTYFTLLSSALSQSGIATNNIIADPYNEPPFSLPGKVTLSTVYRAKGNEAAVVFTLGVDAIPLRTRSGRNRLFTAFTRTKAWLRISGIGADAYAVCSEVGAALAHFPRLNFTMPDLRQVELIQRDLSVRNAKAKKIRDEYAKRMREEGFTEDEIAEYLSGEVK
jgi:superfamily I DNA and RNA helicase